MLLLLCLAGLAGGNMPSNRSPSAVLELSERFLEVKDEGHWFVEFYAPWCGHCKRLAPVWEQMGHVLADELPEVRVGKLDATRFPSVASELNIHGFPSIKYFRAGTVMEYHGDRSKKALVDFARKAYGPEVRPIYPEPRYFLEKHEEHVRDGFFLLVSTPDHDAHPVALEYAKVARDMFVKTFFYSTKPAGLPSNISVPSKLPAVLALGGEGVAEYDGESELGAWVERHRWGLMPELTYGNLHDIGLCCDRFLVIIVSDLVQRKSGGSAAQKLEALGRETMRAHKADLWGGFQLVWVDGNEIANNIVLGTMEVPSLLVLNTSTQLYSLPSDSVHSMTPDSLHLWLLSVQRGEVPFYGGRGFLQRLRRLVYDVYTTIYMMFSTQPLLSVCLFGLPTGILAIICYTLCSVEMSAETEDVYRDSDEDGDLVDHQKRD